MLKDDGLSKLMLRKENELLIKQERLVILETIKNNIVSLSFIPTTEKTIQQKFKLVEQYQEQTKNKLNMFISLNEFYEKVEHSINNFKNTIEKLEKELRSKEQKEIQNGFDIIASVSDVLNFQLNSQTLSVSEFLSYEKRAKQKIKQQNGKG